MSPLSIDFPKNWRVVPIDSVVFYQEGPGVRKHQYTDSGVKLLNGGNINDGILNLDSTSRYVSESEAFGKYGHFLVEEGDLLIACSGVVVEKFDGKIAYATKEHLPLCMNTSTMRFRSLDCKRLDLNFFRRFLQTNYFKSQLQKLITGSAQLNFGPSHIRQMVMPLPPLAEQKRIAAILDKADAIRRKRQQAIQLADDFLRAVFLEMFGDPVTNPKNFPIVKLGGLCEDLFLGLTSKVDYIDSTEGFPLVRAKDINTGELSFEDVKYISQEQHRKLTKNHLTRKGDLLVSKSGTLGTCAIVRTDREFSTYESIFTVRPDCNRLDIYYLIHLLQNKGFKEKLIGNKVGGTVAHLNLKMFRDFEIGVPPIELQKTFSDTILKCEKKLEVYRQSNQHADELFTAISQKAFSGQL